MRLSLAWSTQSGLSTALSLSKGRGSTATPAVSKASKPCGSAPTSNLSVEHISSSTEQVTVKESRFHTTTNPIDPCSLVSSPPPNPQLWGCHLMSCLGEVSRCNCTSRGTRREASQVAHWQAPSSSPPWMASASFRACSSSGNKNGAGCGGVSWCNWCTAAQFACRTHCHRTL